MSRSYPQINTVLGQTISYEGRDYQTVILDQETDYEYVNLINRGGADDETYGTAEFGDTWVHSIIINSVPMVLAVDEDGQYYTWWKAI
jgi:hypothetical protein|tara:strand:+ start:242 stop:505 length:264 start_codon:yes stop_codon:yes gene_type:complete